MLAGGAAVFVFVAQVASCGGDDTGGGAVESDSGADVVADQTTDGVGPEAGGKDSAIDAKFDSQTDGGSDTGIDAPSLGEFNLVLAQTFCKRLEQCCLATSATWDGNKCVTLFSNPAFGGVLGVGNAAADFDGGHIAYNPSLASQCLAQITAFPCGLVSTTQLNTAQALCLSAVPGTIAAGGMGCVSSYECASGTFCATGADGGPGTCSPLIASGGACTSEVQCSYLTNGPPPLYCDTTTSHTCQPRVDVDAGCVDNSECVTNHCVLVGGRAQCTDKGVFSDPGVPNGSCEFFTIQDAGGEGG